MTSDCNQDAARAHGSSLQRIVSRRPYFEDKLITIYHGDCREILPELNGIDATVTDPPYGINFGYESHDDNREGWNNLMLEVTPQLVSKSKMVVMSSGGIDRIGWWFAHLNPRWVIAWYKGSPGHLSEIGFNDWEAIMAWGTPAKRMHDHFQTPCGFDKSGHPCPKPIEWASWLVSRTSPENGMVLDPFMGSGTTLRAAKDLGRRAIGIEIEEKYCEMAANKMAQECLALGG